MTTINRITMGPSEQMAYANGRQDAEKEMREITPEMVQAGVAAGVMNWDRPAEEGVREIYLAMLEARRG